MKSKPTRNVAASVRQKLLNIAQSEGGDFGAILTRYALERLLYRLGESRYRDQYILKGAMLFQAWTNARHRPTRDLDLLGRGDSSPEYCRAVFGEICRIPVADDGLTLLSETISVEKIKEGLEYEGMRVKFIGRIENARIPIQIDIGFGDAVSPDVMSYPTVLAMPAPQIQAYPMEAVVAEKMEALVSLGMLNTRMKDFFDIWFLAQTFAFEGAALRAAIRATFERRKTALNPDNFASLLNELSGDQSKRTQWSAFLRKSSLTAINDFAAVNRKIRDFLLPLSAAAHDVGRVPVEWHPGGPWR